MSRNEQSGDFDLVKKRLAEIAEAVEDEALSLDDALDLYEEAVALGLQASDLLEVGIAVPEDSPTGSGADGDSAVGSIPQPESAAG